MYWYPVYAYVRRQGCSTHDAEDLTQDFFARLIEKQHLHAVHEDRGRFRWFLLATLKCFLANEWHRQQAKKRGGNVLFLSLGTGVVEERYIREPVHDQTPEKIFQRGWAHFVLDRVLSRLRDEHWIIGNEPAFDHLKVHLMGEARRGSYTRLAREIGLTEGAARVAVHRMRRRFGELLRAEIRDTVASEQDVESEIRFLFAAVRQ